MSAESWPTKPAACPWLSPVREAIILDIVDPVALARKAAGLSALAAARRVTVLVGCVILLAGCSGDDHAGPGPGSTEPTSAATSARPGSGGSRTPW